MTVRIRHRAGGRRPARPLCDCAAVACFVERAVDAVDLIAIATDRGQPWTVRRAAITSAARLDADAFDVIASTIIAETSGLDDDERMNAHTILDHFINEDREYIARVAANCSRDDFIRQFATIYDEAGRRFLVSPRFPSAADALGWLWDALRAEGGRGADTLRSWPGIGCTSLPCTPRSSAATACEAVCRGSRIC